MCVEIYTKEPPSSCRFMYLWYIVILIQSPEKEIFHFKWGLIDNVIGFFIYPTAVYESLTLFLYMCLRFASYRKLCLRCVSLRLDHIALLYLISHKEAYEYLFEGLQI